LAATYDMSDYCRTCGTGLKQKAPFQMKGEPKWGRNSIFQLNWVFDEYFVTPDAWAKVFEPPGIPKRPVLSSKGVELKSVLQLDIDQEAELDVQELHVTACAACGRSKYAPVVRGYSPALMQQPTDSMARSRRYFGSGGSAHKLVLVSQALSQSLVSHGIRGASFRPLRSTVK
jgi:hypothetical protein